MSLFAVEEEFAATQNYTPSQLRRLNFHCPHVSRTRVGWASLAGFAAWNTTRHYISRGTIVCFPGGYSQVTEKLAGDSKILLGHEVRQIDYTGYLVDVLTNHGSYHAYQVLVTVPLGVLQAGKIAFNPSLPRTKREAIRKTRMGVFNKVFLKFDKVFWDADFELIGYMGDGDWPEIINFHKITGNPVLLRVQRRRDGQRRTNRCRTPRL